MAVARIRASIGDEAAATVCIRVDEDSLSENDRLLLRASRGATDKANPPPPGEVDDALAFLSWFQLGEQLKVFHIEVAGADAALADRIHRELQD
ncbi:hypothetical protein ACO2Q3_25180 [Caulobacter sp. KR2-114]|uniref:hypothetical protein n=1 Tax=Caulobacter sp. KR2-114 TaxID=3400912 RepID=UPI003BFF8F58